MSKVSIYETGWLNLVFEGRNKAYGAYQLRQESPRTTLFAFFFGLLFIGSLSGAGFLLSSFGTVPVTEPVVDSPPLKIVDYVVPADPTPPELPPAVKTSTPITDVSDAKDLTNDVVVTSTDNADDIKRNDDAPTTKDPVDTGSDTGGVGTTTTGTSTTTVTGTADKPTTNPDAAVPPVNLDVMPEFPGGISKFYNYVGTHFDKPELDETVNVLMSFVIEKDGTMTDIKVLRNPGYGLDKEAIRVLKSLRTK